MADSSTTHQLLDSLTAHIALYHYHSSSKPNSNSGPRAAALRWFSGLSTAHRRAALTVVDSALLQLLGRMLSRLRRLGHGLFFLLPDLPSSSASSSSSSSSMPSLCFRRSRGLLARSAAAAADERALARSLRLFASRDGDSPLSAECPLDALTVSEDLVADVNRFVEIMDGISGGRFLMGEESELSVPWPELSWLKDKGYYSLEAFVANRLEVALRLAWLSSSHGGKKPKGGKAKEKEKAGAAGVAANSFWRKKGCLDWWVGLDPGQRKKILEGFLGKAAKSLANGIVKGSNIALRNEHSFYNLGTELPLRHDHTSSWQRAKLSFFRSDPDFCLDFISGPSSGRPQTVAKYFNKLLVIQEFSALLIACQRIDYTDDTLFFSTLGSAYTVSDCISRKLQGVLMVVSMNYINLELMGGVKLKSLPNKSEEKCTVGSRKGKNKSRNSRKRNSFSKPSKDHDCVPDDVDDSSSKHCPEETTLCIVDNQRTKTVAVSKNLGRVIPSEDKEEHAVNLNDSKGHTSKKKKGKKGSKNKISSSKKLENSERVSSYTACPSVGVENELNKYVGLTGSSTLHPISNGSPVGVKSTISGGVLGCTEMAKSTKVNHELCSVGGNYFTSAESCLSLNKVENGSVFNAFVPSNTVDEEIQQTPPGSSVVNEDISSDKLIRHEVDSSVCCAGNVSGSEITEIPNPQSSTSGSGSGLVNMEIKHCSSGHLVDTAAESVASQNVVQGFINDNNIVIQSDTSECYVYNHRNHLGGTSYEWPSLTPLHFTSINSQHLPAATDRLHLEVGHRWPAQLHQSFLPSRHQGRNTSIECTCCQILPSLTLPMSCDWPPMVRNFSRLSQNMTGNYDSGFNPGFQSPFCSSFAAHGRQFSGTSSEKDRKHCVDPFDAYDLKNTSDLADETESYWYSEEEPDNHAFTGSDYNQFFGGGVMYWNPAEHVGTGFSHPPSHSSDDSAWAWHEAELNRTIDDMVGMPGLSASYSTNGIASPPAASFCTPFDPLGSGHQSVGYALPGNDLNGKVLHSSSSVSDVPEEKVSTTLNNSPGGVEGVKGDTLPYPMLRPIIVPSISRRGSRSDFKLGHDHKSPCIPSSRRDHPRIKRPPSPVVLCVPRVPRPPPPSPVGESRKRGFPIVRSGSSSPRHWGMRSWFSGETNFDETRVYLDGAEVVWPSWRNKGLSTMAQSIQGSLLQDHLITISQLARDQEHPDVALPLQPPNTLNSCHKVSLSLMHNLLHEEIDAFCKQVATENLMRKPYINWAIKRVTRSLQVLWPRSRTNIFGSNATGLALPSSDVDLVVSLPPVRNLEPIKEAGILEGRNGIKETCLQHAARYLVNQEWVRNDSLKTIENTAIPVIMLVAEVPDDIDFSNENSSVVDTSQVHSTRMPGEQGSEAHPNLSSSENTSWSIWSKMKKDDTVDVKSIRLDISFKSPSHTGLQTSELVRELTKQFPACVPLALVLKKFLADRSLDHSYSGGLSSYCLVLLITRFLQHEHHISRPISQNLGGLLMDFLYFFGNVFDPRQMRVSIQGSGLYMNRERGLSIDPIHIDDPLYPTNNVGRNCFRIHQCIKAFADAYSVLENELPHFSGDAAPASAATFRLLPKIIPSINHED